MPRKGIGEASGLRQLQGSLQVGEKRSQGQMRLTPSVPSSGPHSVETLPAASQETALAGGSKRVHFDLPYVALWVTELNLRLSPIGGADLDLLSALSLAGKTHLVVTGT